MFLQNPAIFYVLKHQVNNFFFLPSINTVPAVQKYPVILMRQEN